MTKNITEEMFSIEELEARLEMTAVMLSDGSMVEGSQADYEADPAGSKIKCGVTVGCTCN